MGLKLKDLKDQVIVITGASSGIGLATARMAADKGAKVVAAARNEEALKELVEELNNKGHEAIFVEADVGKEEDVQKIADAAIRKFGRFDTWVNNAAVTIFGHMMEVTIEDMRRMFDTTFWGVVYGMRAAAKHYIDRGEPGSIINVGSLYGDRGVVLQSTYSSAKFAVHGMTENVRMEMEKDNAPVSISLIHPGRIDTPYNEHARSYAERQPAHIGMIYTPEAVADAILYCAAHPKRDMYVGAQAKMTALLGRGAPRFTDKLMEVLIYPTQLANRPSRPREDSALYGAGYGMKERGTNKGWVRKRSYYVQATKRPMLTAVALASVGALIWNTAKKR